MRIVAGKYASRKLETLKGQNTRPTLDKVKEAVFSSLGGFFDGGMVLDLYGGSGAIAFEALSRGMDHACIVDKSRAAIEIIRKNAKLLDCSEQCDIYPMSDRKALSLCKDRNMQFDLVYLDPPYERQHNKEILAYLDENDMVRPGGDVVIESLKEEEYRENYGHLVYRKEVVYGIMKITYYRHQ